MDWKIEVKKGVLDTIRKTNQTKPQCFPFSVHILGVVGRRSKLLSLLRRERIPVVFQIKTGSLRRINTEAQSITSQTLTP